MIDNLLNAKLPPHSKRSINLAYLENGIYDKIVAHLEKGLELSVLEHDAELLVPSMTATLLSANQQETEETKIVSHYSKKPGHVIRK